MRLDNNPRVAAAWLYSPGSRRQEDVSGNCIGRLPNTNGEESLPIPEYCAGHPVRAGQEPKLARLRAERRVAQVACLGRAAAYRGTPASPSGRTTCTGRVPSGESTTQSMVWSSIGDRSSRSGSAG